MSEDPHVRFRNSQNPKATFDFLALSRIFHREDLDHSPLSLHHVGFYMIILITEGEGFHTIDFKEYPCKRGTLLTVRKDQIHKFHFSPSIKGRLLLFTDDFLVSYLEKLEALRSLQLFNEFLGGSKVQLEESALSEIILLTDRIKDEYFNLNDDYTMGIIRSELHILIAKLYRIKSNFRESTDYRKYLKDFIHFQKLVEQHASEFRKVKDYGKLMGLSTKTLNTITKHIIHKTAKEFVDEICTNQLKRLLINTDLSIKEIAFSTGFDESTNFYKYFKRQTNSTPEQFRSNFR